VYIGDVLMRDKITAKPFYDPRKPSALSSLAKLQAAIKQTKGKIFHSLKHKPGWNAKTHTHYVNLLGNIFPEIRILSLM